MKKTALIIAIVVGIIICITAGIVIFTLTTLNQFHEDGIEAAQVVDENNKKDNDSEYQDTNKSENSQSTGVVSDPYVEMINNSKRINVLCMGIAKYSLADTIIVASFDPEAKSLDLISVPRDTYFYRSGFEMAAEKKINASYYGKTTAERAQSAMNSVRDALQIPIHHFVKIEYKGVEKIVDSIGGVEVKVPFNMDYDDPTDDLHIHFEKGTRVLKGEDAVRYLRFRGNNDNSHSDGDVGRVKRQQDFIMKAMDKSLGLQLVGMVNTARKYVKTSMTADEMILYARELSQFDIENVKTYTLPGDSKYMNGASYYIQDKQATKEMMTGIYQKGNAVAVK